MTTLKERLLEDFDTLVDTYRASRQETRAMLDTYAIGRWVSVEERFPPCRFIGDVIHTNFGQGIFIVDQKTGEHGTFINRVCSAGCHIKSDITHWLDLDLPDGKEEA